MLTRPIVSEHGENGFKKEDVVKESFKYRLMATRQKTIAAFIVITPFLFFIYTVYYTFWVGVPAFFIYLWAVMHFLGMCGISLGFHRLASHSSFKPHRAIKMFFLILGSASGQGSVIYWASHHRRHHHKADKPGDVHSPYIGENGKVYKSKLEGLFHAYTGWIFETHPSNPVKYSKDLLKDRDVLFINRYYYLWILAGIVSPGFIGLLYEPSVKSFLLGVLFGGLARLCTVQHATWFVNAIAHMFGKKPYRTNDNSTNFFWASIPTVGEAWHNNHHAFPYSARMGLEWWEIDLGYYFLLVLKFFGLVTDVKIPSKSDMKNKKNLKSFKNE